MHFHRLSTSDAQIRWNPRVWEDAHKHTGKSHMEPQIHKGLISEGTIPSRVTKEMLLNQMPVGEWNIGIKEMALISGDRQNRTILQKSTDRVSKSKKKSPVCFCFFQSDGCLVVCHLPASQPQVSVCLAETRLGPRKVFTVASPPWALSCEHPMYHGSLLSGVTAKNCRTVMER